MSSVPDGAQAPGPQAGAAAPPTPRFADALKFWFQLGWISFGGPAGQIALMHAELVERRRWISERRFLHALNYCMLLPGPEAQQLATYLGWLMHRSWGGIAAGALFVLPSLLLLVLLSWVYVRHGDVPWVAALFYGLKPAVTALVLQAAWRIGQRTLKHPLLWAIAGAAFAALFLLRLPFPAIVAAAALAGLLGARWCPQAFSGGGHGAGKAAAAPHAPAWIDDHTPTPAHARFHRGGLLRVVLGGVGLGLVVAAALWALQGGPGLFTRMAGFFTQAALLSFGGAYAVLPFVAQGAVEQHQWLSAPQMIDGLALGETTPGPLIMVVAFVAFLGGWGQPAFGPDSALATAVLAAVVVSFFTFLPSFVFILAGGPLVEATHGRLGFTAPLAAISAAVVGVIVNLALFFAQHVFWPRGFSAGLVQGFDGAAACIATAAALALMRFKLGVIPVLAGCAAAGLAWRLATGAA